MLESEGVVVRMGERKAFQVAGQVAGPSGDRAMECADRKVVFMVHQPLDHVADSSRRLIEQIRGRVRRKGWQEEVCVVDYLHAKRPRRVWDELIPHEVGVKMVALYGRPSLADWALRNHVDMLFLGGVTEGRNVPMVGVKSALMAADTLARLTALGHTRIMLPLCDRPESFKVGIREATRRAIESAGGHYQGNYHNPESPYLQPDVLLGLLERGFAGNPPTALVFLDWKELISAQGFLARRGLRIPEDVSVVLLNDAVSADWFHPLPCRYRFPIRRIASMIVHWLEHGAGDLEGNVLSGEFIAGGSIAEPKRR